MEAKKPLTPTQKRDMFSWDEFNKSIQEETEVEENLTHAEREKKRLELEADPVAWICYFFPKSAKYPFARFHVDFIKRIVKNPDWYEVLSWARELAKSSTTRMVVLYLILTGKLKNILLISATQDSAKRLFRPFRGHLENNQRIKYFYGDQMGTKWTEDELVTRNNVAVRALGYGNAPRGTISDDVRPDCVILDDFDTDEECRNPETLKHKWDWFEEAVYFTRSWSEPLRVIWCGNVIAKDCCIVRAGTRAQELAQRDKPLGNWDIINIRMVNIKRPNAKADFREGATVWPAKNSEERIDIVLSQVSAASAQKECFNNPVSEGDIFKDLIWGKVPPLSKFKFLVAYGDPAPGENKGKKNSYKGVALVGKLGDTYYVVKAYLNLGLNSDFIDWYFQIDDYVGGKTVVYNLIENNSLQDPFFQQVFKKLLKAACRRLNRQLSVAPDERKKTDKATRIEANLEPVNREGKLVFNEKEKDDPHMKRLVEQFELFNLHLTFPADGPDMVEGAKRIIDIKMAACAKPTYIPVTAFRKRNKYRF